MATSDPATRYSDIQADKLSKKIERIYTQAAREVRQKIADFERQHNAINARMLEDLQAGKITESQYKSWLRGQVFTGEQWKKKLEDITHVYMNADEVARSMLKQTQRNVFAESANYTAYDVAMHSRAGYSFQIYDKNTVDRLIRDNPQMLPEWKIDEEKDYVWNEKRVRNAVTQGIVQGESVHDIGRRLTSELAARNASKMDMFARTAITGAQNAGRMERLHEAEDMGIVVKKKWLATLDDRTRDTHAELDGQVRNIDEPFEVDGMQIDYPGDPTAPPELVYNCRCTLIYVYPQFQQDNYGQRRIQETGEVVDYLTYNQWKNQQLENNNENETVDFDSLIEESVAITEPEEIAEPEEAESENERETSYQRTQADYDYLENLHAEREKIASGSAGSQGAYLMKNGAGSRQELLTAMKNGTLPDWTNQYFDALEANGSTASHKPLTDQVVLESGGDASQKRLEIVEQMTGTSGEEALQMKSELDKWVSNAWDTADTETLDKYIDSDGTYNGDLWRGLHFDTIEERSNFVDNLGIGSVVNVGQPGHIASWSSDKTDAETFAGAGSHEIIFHCIGNKSASPIAFANRQGEREVISHSGSRYTVLGVSAEVTEERSRTIITVVEKEIRE